MTTPLSPEEEKAYRESVTDVTGRRGDNWTETPYWVRRLLATLDAALPQPVPTEPEESDRG
jgi:hypothetical protein